MSQALYRKYRPMTFGDVTDQNHVKITVQNQIANGTVSHAYLFSGPRGVGKTTIARLLAKTVNCENRAEGGKEPCNTCTNCEEMNIGKSLDIVEIDAASHTGVDNVRENIIESVRFSPSKAKCKVFIIDEVHMLSTSAFNALLKTLEEPPAHALFVLATTEIHKIPQTILSRCQRFDFHRIATPDMIKRLKEIAKAEGVTVADDVLAQIARLSEGCLRDAESLLGQILALGEKEITKEGASIILPVTNTRTVNDLVDAIVRNDVTSALNLLNEFVDQGGSIKNFTDETIDFVRTMLLLKLGAPYHDHYDAATTENMRRHLERFSAHDCSRLLDALLDVRNRPTYDALPHLPLEIAIVLFCDVNGDSLGKDEEGGRKERETGGKKRDTEIVKSEMQDQNVSSQALNTGAQTSSSEEAASSPDKPDISSNSTTFTIEELKSKWGRCCEVIKKKSVALPLALQGVEFGQSGEYLEIGFKTKFHFENMQQAKNLGILRDAINEIMGSDIKVKPVYLEEEAERTIGTLVEAFGGQVVD